MFDKYLKKNIFISTFLLFGMGFLLHFAYDFFNKPFLIGLFSPVNESLFEHLKLAIFPILGWWIIFYLVKKEKLSLNKDKWFFGCLISMIISILVILFVYYFVKYGIGKELLVIDIMSLYIALFIGQFAGYYVYKTVSKSSFIISIIIISIFIITFVFLTVYPPKLPLFKDNQTNTYGIRESID